MYWVCSEIAKMRSTDDPIPPHVVGIIAINLLIRSENRQQTLRAATIYELQRAAKRVRVVDGVTYRVMIVKAKLKNSKYYGHTRVLISPLTWLMLCQYFNFIRPRYVEAWK
jgi:hypothetical protein